jgi:SAM-dependent methyltransferase
LSSGSPRRDAFSLEPASGLAGEGSAHPARRALEKFFPRARSARDGFAHPALRALDRHFPRLRFPGGQVQTVERIHAEAEIARIETLRLRIRAATLGGSAAVLDSGSSQFDAARLAQTAQKLESFSERLFEEAGHVGGVALVSEARPPFESMCDWLRRLAEIDPDVCPDVDLKHVIWMSLFQTLAEHTELSQIKRVMGVGVGFDGPEVFYDDYFNEHYCLDLVDYSYLNPQLKFIVADIEKGVDSPDACFDLIYSHSVFEHLKNVDRAMAEIDRLVKLGKYIYITISPLYYSPTGSHVNVPTRLTHWEHLDPASGHYLLDTPDPSRIDEGVFLNRLTVSGFLAAVGRVGWEVRHFSMRIVHPRDVPVELRARFPLVDLVVEELRFVGRKVIPKAEGIEW